MRRTTRQDEHSKSTTLKQGSSGSRPEPDMAPAAKKPRVISSGGEGNGSESFASPLGVAPTSSEQAGLMKPSRAGGSSIHKPSPPQASLGTSSPVLEATEGECWVEWCEQVAREYIVLSRAICVYSA